VQGHSISIGFCQQNLLVLIKAMDVRNVFHDGFCAFFNMMVLNFSSSLFLTFYTEAIVGSVHF
jgi:hypothetical protein